MAGAVGWARGVAAVAGATLLLTACWKDRGYPPDTTDAQAVDVNAGGSILVRASGSAGFAGFVVGPDGGWTPLGTLAPGDNVTPAAINDAGTVVGNVFGASQPFVWDPGDGMRTLES